MSGGPGMNITPAQPVTSGGMLTRSEDIPGGHAYCDAEAARLREKVAGYENAVTWDTTCLSCATVLDSAYAETCRAELAEAILAEVRKFCTGDPRAAGSLVAADVLDILNRPTT